MISVIVPIYNTEDYLESCIDSVLNSSYKDFELILVDDGSTDKCNQICQKYVHIDDRVRLLSQDNKGVSAARNRGIDDSKGDWVVFLDSDDTISDCFLELVHNVGEKTNSEFLLFDYAYSNSKHEVKSGYEILKKTMDDEERCELVRRCLRMKQLSVGGNVNLPSPCAKAYRRNIIVQNALYFKEDISLGEDELFNLAYYNYIFNYTYVNTTVYYVSARETSLTHKYRPCFLNEDYMFLSYLKNYLMSSGMMNEVMDVYIDVVLSSVVGILRKCVFHKDNQAPFEEKKDMCRKINQYDIYQEALKKSNNYGSFKRRIFLLVYKLEFYKIVQLFFYKNGK